MPVITFSQKFQTKHPRKGEPTHFVEQILNQLGCDFQYQSFSYWTKLVQLNHEKIKSGKLTEKQIEDFILDLNFELDTSSKKLHTIRNGSRFSAGEKFTPAVWSGKPYHSPQIIFYDDIEVKAEYNFSIDAWGSDFRYNIYQMLEINGLKISGKGTETHNMNAKLEEIAKNDGLSLEDFKAWFGTDKPKNNIDFSGQIICWADPKYLQA
jgi:hypothetical protein